MAVIRVEKTKNYTVMANYHLRDNRLSFKAKGLMSFMLSLPDDWDYTVAGLATCAKDGKDSVRGALKELEAAGYLTRERTRDKQGKLRSTDYVLSEEPKTIEPEATEPTQEEPVQENSTTENPILENPTQGKPTQENPTQINTNILSTKELSTDKRKGDKPPAFQPPTVGQVRKYCEERGNQVDPEIFVDFYHSKGWIVGKNKMKDWQAAVRTWEKREGHKASQRWAKRGDKKDAISTVQRLAAKYAAEEGLG